MRRGRRDRRRLHPRNRTAPESVGAPMSTWEEIKRDTEAAFEAPRTGDVFHDMYSFWVAVLWADDRLITYVTKAGAQRGPGEAKLFATTVTEFRKRFSEWALLAKRDAD